MSDKILESIQSRMAINMVETLSKNERNTILSNAVGKVLERINLDHEITKILKEEAGIFAREYIQEPAVQERLRSAAREVIDDTIDGIIRVLGGAMESDIKNKYVRIISGAKYSDHVR